MAQLTLQQIVDGMNTLMTMRFVKYEGKKIMAMSGIDFTDRFGSIWSDEHGAFLFPHNRGAHHAMTVFNAYSDKNMALIREYIDKPEFDWQNNMSIIPYEEDDDEEDDDVDESYEMDIEE